MMRIKMKDGPVTVHCLSRIVGAQKLLDDWGKEKLTEMLRKQAAFCGVEVIAYCIMSNHFHVLVRVAPTPPLSDGQLIERLECLYGRQGDLTLLARQAVAERGKIDENLRQRLLARMGDVSVFMKELKQRFSLWYNGHHERFGTLWAERFKSVLVEDQPTTLEVVAAYIDLNPVRAGLVEDPKDYRFCGYADALAGNKVARQGYQGLRSFPPGKRWAEGAAEYRQRLFLRAGTAGQSGKVVLTKEQIRAVLKRGGALSVGEVFRLRVRHLSDGVALGTRGFVNEVFARHREKFGAKRKDGARPIRALASLGLTTLRDLRVRALG
jgi:REP element-mobilizing transposase RayT